MEDYFWEYKVARKNEATKRDLPKSRISAHFKTKEQALKYAKDKKSTWLQAYLYQYKNGRGFVAIASINTKGVYSEKYL